MEGVAAVAGWMGPAATAKFGAWAQPYMAANTSPGCRGKVAHGCGSGGRALAASRDRPGMCAGRWGNVVLRVKLEAKGGPSSGAQ